MTVKIKKNNSGGWQNIPVADIFSFVRSHAFSRENLTTGLAGDDKIGNIHYGDIHSSYKAPSIDLDKMPIPLINDQSFNPSVKDLLVDGDLVMADASEDYEGIGVTVSIHGVNGKRVVGGLHTFVLRDEKGKTNEYYRQYIFRNPVVRNKLQKVANGVSVYGISKTEVSKIVLPIPPLPEQNRIVAVLETWDKAIDRLAQKIELKKKIKKGLMQRLLTGKIRLPGFSEKWQTNGFVDIFEVLKKPAGIKTNEYLESGLFPVVDQSKDKIYSGYSNNADISFDFIDKPVVVFGDHSRVIKFIKQKVVFGNDGIKLFMNKANLNIKFGYYLLKNYNVPETGYNRHFKYLEIAFFDMPGIKEQNAIAKVLTVADDEINVLKIKISQLKNQKKYLLNNLITGTIRTPENFLCNNGAGPETMKINA